MTGDYQRGTVPREVESSAYGSCALHTNFYISDIYIAHIDDEISMLNIKANARE